jgi:hypothetical protein
MVEISFFIFAVLALALFRILPTATAVAVACFGGWLLLPVGNYPAGSASAVFPYWITGTAVPSDMLFTKMWWPPVIALAGALLADRPRIKKFRIDWVDLPLIAWCLWPLVQVLFVQNPDPQPWIASLYLVASWGSLWLLGRIYFSGFEGYRLFIVALTASLVILLPIALIEGVWSPKVYGWLYEPHAFRFDGIERYVGFRPLGFFEDGNQYGIWVAATALAALWLPFFPDRNQTRPWLFAVAPVAVLVALASQSLGAILLLFAGIAISVTLWKGSSRWVLGLTVLLLVIGGAVYLSGKLPLRSLAENTSIGRHIVDLVRGLGRGSFTWRIARDQAGLAVLNEHVGLGTGHWDWWRESGQRPWSLVLLIVGQFGVVGLLLAFGAFGAACLRSVLSDDRAAVPIIAIICMGVGDALLNSFFFYPAILAAGGLATRLPPKSVSFGAAIQMPEFES